MDPWTKFNTYNFPRNTESLYFINVSTTGFSYSLFYSDPYNVELSLSPVNPGERVSQRKIPPKIWCNLQLDLADTPLNGSQLCHHNLTNCMFHIIHHMSSVCVNIQRYIFIIFCTSYFPIFPIVRWIDFRDKFHSQNRIAPN